MYLNQVQLTSLITNLEHRARILQHKNDIQELTKSSLLIILNQSLNILHHLTGSPSIQRSYFLVTSLEEISSIITEKYKFIRSEDVIYSNMIYFFQITENGDLFMILKLLLPNKLRIIDFIEIVPWPKILRVTLQIPDTDYRCVVKLNEQHFISATPTWTNQCIQSSKNCLSSSVPLRISSNKTSCEISQFYDIKPVDCQYIYLESKLFSC